MSTTQEATEHHFLVICQNIWSSQVFTLCQFLMVDPVCIRFHKTWNFNAQLTYQINSWILRKTNVFWLFSQKLTYCTNTTDSSNWRKPPRKIIALWVFYILFWFLAFFTKKLTYCTNTTDSSNWWKPPRRVSWPVPKKNYWLLVRPTHPLATEG